MQIEKLNIGDQHTRSRIADYLAPHEAYALFILGNLKLDFPGTHLYAAAENGQWFGIAGYYSSYTSVSLFAENAKASRALTHHAAMMHPGIRYLSGAESCALPALDELLSQGYKMLADPQLTFMELEGQPPYQTGEEFCRPFREEDIERIAELLRYRHNQPLDDEATRVDLDNIRKTPLCYVLTHNEQVVSVASTNGMGIRTFQILGVATDESFRGRGFAAAVCASVIREMHRRGAIRCVLFTEKSNIPAQRCYLRMGFRMSGHFYLARLQPPVVI
jgi:ribosomal protein S18 acetylase RimI-like enzyme